MKVLIFLLLLYPVVTSATPLSNWQQAKPAIEVRNSVEFVVTIRAILTDPIEGYWLLCQSGNSRVLIWENDVHNLTIGVKYRILCAEIGYKVYPETGRINIYDGIVWTLLEDE